MSALALLPGLLAEKRAGNEDYYLHARQSLQGKHARRSSTPTFLPESISFDVGSTTSNTTKYYVSPTGSEYKSYSLMADWSLDSYAGQTYLVTVFQVSGTVTCDTLGKLVQAYEQADDVYDQVSG